MLLPFFFYLKRKTEAFLAVNATHAARWGQIKENLASNQCDPLCDGATLRATLALRSRKMRHTRVFSYIKNQDILKTGDGQQFIQETLAVHGRLRLEVAADSERLISLRSS